MFTAPAKKLTLAQLHARIGSPAPARPVPPAGAPPVSIRIEDLVRDLECPICLKPLKDPAVVVACLHRFCGDCIKRALRHSVRLCPVCRTSCPSRRSTRPDFRTSELLKVFRPQLDAFAAAEEDDELDEEQLANIARIQAQFRQQKARDSRNKANDRRQRRIDRPPARRQERLLEAPPPTVPDGTPQEPPMAEVQRHNRAPGVVPRPEVSVLENRRNPLLSVPCRLNQSCVHPTAEMPVLPFDVITAARTTPFVSVLDYVRERIKPPLGHGLFLAAGEEYFAPIINPLDLTFEEAILHHFGPRLPILTIKAIPDATQPQPAVI